MDSDDSTHTVFNTISQFENSDIYTPDGFKNSEPSPSTFSQPSFYATQFTDESSPAPSSYTDANPIISPMNSDQPDPPSPVTEALEHELDNFINLQQQLLNTKNLTFHHILHPDSSAESSNQKPTAVETRAHSVIKRKHPLLNPTYFTTPDHPIFFNSKTSH